MTGSWANWAGNQTATATSIRPRGTEQIVDAVLTAAARGQRIKPIGSGHSFTGIGRPAADGLQLGLDRHADVISLDNVSGLVTVQAGMPLHRLNQVLAGAGLALTNLGDIDRQTVAGALATGTHGTGAHFGGLATQVRGLELVLADGRVLTCSPAEHPEIFGPARVNLGALGVLSSFTLQAVPAFALHAREAPTPLAEVLDRFQEFADETDHFEFFWFPHTDSVLLKRNNRVALDSGLNPLPGWRHWWDDEFLSNTVFGATIALGRRFPATIRPINWISARALGARSYVDRSDRVFVSSRRVRFIEMEYAVPRAAAAEVITSIRAAIDAFGWSIGFPIEVRVAAADDIALSMGYGRESAYIAVHSPVGVEHAAYFSAVERIMAEHEGRPHWGKMHQLDAEALRRRYPRFGEFVELRNRLDPGGLFANDYLDRVLGPVPGVASVAR